MADQQITCQSYLVIFSLNAKLKCEHFMTCYIIVTMMMRVTILHIQNSENDIVKWYAISFAKSFQMWYAHHLMRSHCAGTLGLNLKWFTVASRIFSVNKIWHSHHNWWHAGLMYWISICGLSVQRLRWPYLTHWRTIFIWDCSHVSGSCWHARDNYRTCGW